MDKLSDAAAREWRADARAAHDDPLLDCLVEITRLHGVAATAQALSAGLPLESHRLTPALLPRAAARAQLSARVVKRPLDGLPSDLLPAILLLNGERACLLLKRDGDKCVISHPELGGSAVEMSAAELDAQYTGLVCFVRPQFRFDARARRKWPRCANATGSGPPSWKTGACTATRSSPRC
ncbi:type I secretion system ATPase [Achromobacter xylosoxidans]|nr:type I secretion system ATPase [Achromobacter xylosoxidans]